jgi:hypothetical protein
MSLKAYLDNIKAKTGKTPEDFKKLAAKKGLLEGEVKAGPIVAWLKKDFELGHGHAMAIYHSINGKKPVPPEQALEKHFAGEKAPWKPVFNNLIKKIRKNGNDVSISPAASYLSILRGKKKLAIVRITRERMDIGLKLKNIPPTKRFESAGSWKMIVTHRVSIRKAKEIDGELVEWLDKAYIYAEN